MCVWVYVCVDSTDLDDEFKQFIGFLESFQHLVDCDHDQHMGVLARQGYCITVGEAKEKWLTGSACFMMSLQFLSTWLNRRPSSGI